jgi:hypothetical protein
MELKNYALVLHFDNQQEYNVMFQAPALENNQIDNILNAVVRGSTNIQGIVVNPQRILFARIMEIPNKTQEANVVVEEGNKEDIKG